ncbi:hypothetical protein Ahia01_000470200 [Argonauta hians]
MQAELTLCQRSLPFCRLHQDGYFNSVDFTKTVTSILQTSPRRSLQFCRLHYDGHFHSVDSTKKITCGLYSSDDLRLFDYFQCPLSLSAISSVMASPVSN